MVEVFIRSNGRVEEREMWMKFMRGRWSYLGGGPVLVEVGTLWG